MSNSDELLEEYDGEIERNGTIQSHGSNISDELEDQPSKNNGSLLGRKGLNRRNSLQNERSKTITTKKQGLVPTKSEGTIQNPNLLMENKRLSLHDLPKSNSPAAHLMPPPRAPFGKA